MPSALRYLPLVVAPLLLMPVACGGSADAPTESEAPELTSVSFDESSIHLDLQSKETVRVMPINGGSKGYIAARAGTSKTISLGPCTSSTAPGSTSSTSQPLTFPPESRLTWISRW